MAKYREGGHKFLRALLSGYGRRGNSDGLDITYHIADKDENEHSLKKMLSSDAVVKEAVYEWFSLENEEEIAKRLDEEIATSSKISDPLARKLHEELYKKCDLINWMQETGAIRYKEDCISKPNSQIYQIYVKGYRNEIIARMVDKEGWKCKNRCTIKEEENKDPNNVKIKEIPYFWPSREIEVTKELNGQQIVCKFDKENITVVNTSCSYPYAQEVLSEADIDKCINWINKQIQSL